MATIERARFTAMTEGTQADWDIIRNEAMIHSPQGGRRVLDHLKLLDGDAGGFPVDRLTHSLQTATRALRDGRPDSYVVMALLHDIGDTLGAYNHPDIGAAILKPFVSEEEHWICQNHGIFQGYYFFQYIGLDRDMREQFRGHPHFEACAEFCARYDQTAFDPAYDTLPIEAFEPMVMKLFARPRASIYKAAIAAE
ncbi:MAG: phosphohydrolase [Sandarakinorhabdus sp.]|nr:phosphohydrolase [Sandarakinorhabdus sp.]